MELLRIRILGGFEMERAGAILSPPATPKSRSLLAYLLLNRDRLVHRETACAALWPDETEAVARKALRTALWRIRSALAGDGTSDCYVYADAFQVGFRASAPVWVDVWDFDSVVTGLETRSDAALDAADGEAMVRAALLYRGNAAAGVYDEWIVVEQARLQHAQLALLERLAGFHAARQHWLQAIGWAERALAVDPLREHLHRLVMSCFMSMGDRPSALRQYVRCETVLRKELGIDPMPETRDLRDAMRPPAAPQPAAGWDEAEDVGIDVALANLRRIARELERSRSDGHSSQAQIR